MFCFSDFPHWWPLLKDHDQSQARGFHANHSRVFHPCMFAICIHTRECVLGNAEFVSNGTPPFMVKCHIAIGQESIKISMGSRVRKTDNPITDLAYQL